MAMTKKHVMEWLDSLPQNAVIGIDDGGLTLVVEEDDGAYLEVGGLEQSEDD